MQQKSAKEGREIIAADVARAASVAPASVAYWLADTNGVSAAKARLIGDFLGVNPVWLEAGIGEPHTQEIPPDQEVKELLQDFPEFKQVVPVDDESSLLYTIPKVKLKLQAGITGFEMEPDRRDHGVMGIPRNWADRKRYNPQHLIGIDVEGESMEPTFYEGDVVVVNIADKHPVDNVVFAINYEGQAVIKRFLKRAGAWWLTSDNEDQDKYRPMRCDGLRCIVIGRVVRREGDNF